SPKRTSPERSWPRADRAACFAQSSARSRSRRGIDAETSTQKTTSTSSRGRTERAPAATRTSAVTSDTRSARTSHAPARESGTTEPRVARATRARAGIRSRIAQGRARSSKKGIATILRNGAPSVRRPARARVEDEVGRRQCERARDLLLEDAAERQDPE